MTYTADITTVATGADSRGSQRRRGDIGARWAGAGGIGFATVVIAQNIIRGASAPANDATSAEVMTSYADHRTITFILVSMFIAGGVGLAVFLGGAMRDMLDSGRRAWALTGYVGSIGIIALFSVLVGAEEALSVVAARSQPDLSAIDAIWALHNGVFTVLLLSIAVALLGLSRAGVSAGITPRVFEWIAPIASALLLVGVAAGPAIAAGDALPLFAASAIGFLVWLSFLATTGVRLMRSAGAR